MVEVFVEKMTGFDEYVESYESARSEAQVSIDQYSHCTDPQRREELLVEARNCLDEVERYIRILENEANEVKSPQGKRKQGDQVRHCKTQMTSLTSALEKAILIGDARTKTTEPSTDRTEREQAIQYADRMDRNGRHLNEAQRTLAETEAIAANTANNLLQQRNQLQRAQLDVDQAQADTQEAGSHLRRLGIKAITNKLILWLVMFCLSIGIILAAYYKWYPCDKKDYLGILPSMRNEHTCKGTNSTQTI